MLDNVNSVRTLENVNSAGTNFSTILCLKSSGKTGWLLGYTSSTRVGLILVPQAAGYTPVGVFRKSTGVAGHSVRD